MLLNVHVGQPMANMKCCTKNVFFLSKKADSCTTFVNWMTGQHFSPAVCLPLRGILRLSIFFTKGKVKVNIQNNPINHYICKLY